MSDVTTRDTPQLDRARSSPRIAASRTRRRRPARSRTASAPSHLRVAPKRLRRRAAAAPARAASRCSVWPRSRPRRCSCSSRSTCSRCSRRSSSTSSTTSSRSSSALNEIAARPRSRGFVARDGRDRGRAARHGPPGNACRCCTAERAATSAPSPIFPSRPRPPYSPLARPTPDRKRAPAARAASPGARAATERRPAQAPSGAKPRLVRSRGRRPRIPARRLALCSVLVIVVFGALAVRVTQLQVLSGNRYKLMSLEQTLQHGAVAPRSAARSSTATAATSRCRSSSTTVYADPQQVARPDRVRGRARAGPARERGRAARDVSATPQVRVPQYLAHRRERQRRRRRCSKLDLAGIGFVPESARRYPAGPLAGSLIGAVGGDGVGLTGLESCTTTMLAGPGRASSSSSATSRASTSRTPRRTRSRRGAAPTSCSRSTSRCSGRPSSRSSTR